jgi:phosphopantothenoylcysteine decarboxylase/phosphopantothenate--cysteine ligase
LTGPAGYTDSHGSSSYLASDLAINPVSEALSGWELDVVVSGSIGAVESVKVIRSLRRLGGSVTPWLTRGGAEFVTPQSLSWAAARETITSFSGTASHIAVRHGCIVAPASASLIAKIAHGQTDTPASALVASYLGNKKPVLLVPNMHNSLYQSPGIQENLKKIESYGVKVLGARTEEGKQKFPLSETLADVCAHELALQTSGSKGRVLVTMGTTRGYIDDVRYISNYSSGALGTAISHELYRNGFETIVVCGPCPVRPTVATKVIDIETNAEMEAAIGDSAKLSIDAAVLAASVLDFIPKVRQTGKIRSDSDAGLTLELSPSKKLIKDLKTPIKVGFKLESGLTEASAEQFAKDYISKYGLSLFVINDLADVSATKHQAKIFKRNGKECTSVESKGAIAHAICQHILSNGRD